MLNQALKAAQNVFAASQHTPPPVPRPSCQDRGQNRRALIERIIDGFRGPPETETAPLSYPSTAHSVDALACLVDLDLTLPPGQASTVTIDLDSTGKVFGHDVVARSSVSSPHSTASCTPQALSGELDVAVASFPATITVLIDAQGRIEGCHAQPASLPESQRAIPIEEEAEQAADIPYAPPTEPPTSATTNERMSYQDISLDGLSFPCTIDFKLDDQGNVFGASFESLSDAAPTRSLNETLAELDIVMDEKSLPCAVRAHLDENGRLIQHEILKELSQEMTETKRETETIAPTTLSSASLARRNQPEYDAGFVCDVTIADACVLPPSAVCFLRYSLL